jgi:3-oxoacyl-[acyl-carrier-protein] synthase II
VTTTPKSVAVDRIAVTGVGIVSALGVGADATFRRLLAGERGFSPIREFDPKNARCRFAAVVEGMDIAAIAPRAERATWSRTDALALPAAREALSQARFSSGRLGVAHAGTTGAMLETERDLVAPSASPQPERALRFLTDPLCATTERLVRTFGAGAVSSTVCAACASSAIAIVQASEWIRRGVVDVALAGGADALCALTFFGFESLGALDPEPCRPFDVGRRGLSLGEAGAFLVLERESRARARDASILAFLTGAATGAEAHHVTHPEPSGERAAALVRRAIEGARLAPADVDYVNAHGTGTLPNDRMEALALRSALGEAAPNAYVSSSKAQLGHTLGAAAALEAAITVLALSRGRVPATAGLEMPEDPLLRHVRGSSLAAPLRAALSCSFGFGGTGAVLLFETSTAEPRALPNTATRVVVTGACAIGPRGFDSGAALATYLDPEPRAAVAPYELDPRSLLDPTRSRRFDRAAALVTAVVGRALSDAGTSEASSGLVMGTAFGSVERSVRFVEKALLGGPRVASPAEFPHLVVSAASGNASIYLGLKGPVFAVSDRETSAESALSAAVSLLVAGQATAFVAGAAEAFDPLVQAIHPKLGGRAATSERGEGAAFLVVENEAAALARGARVLARVVGPFAVAEGESGADFWPPSPRGRAEVVTGALSRALEAVLERSPWGAPPRRSVLPASGCHEASGAFALAAAVSLVASGRADEALAVSGRSSVLWLTHFSRVEGG